tara:strand:- start:150 stop:488 length:339 start_codon:yes stop_codon:yes gene_type:complete
MSDNFRVATDLSACRDLLLDEGYVSVMNKECDPGTIKKCGSEWCVNHMPIADKNILCADCRRKPFCIDCGKHRRMNDDEDLCHPCFDATYCASSDEESSDEEWLDEDPMSRE